METIECSYSLCLRASFTINHAMACQHGGLTSVCHNNLRDITADLLSKVCSDVVIEPPLQPLSGEVIYPKSANWKDDARADVCACGF